jgi:hypothetical protein
MHVRWTLAAAALSLAACSSTRSTGSDATAVSAEPTKEQQAGASERTVEQNQAEEQATAARPTEGPQGQDPHPTPPGGAAAGGDHVQGKVVMVDEAAREIAIDAGDATTQVHVADDARITVDGKEAKLSDLARGSDVRVSLDRSGDQPAAVVIEAQPRK